MGWGPWDRAEQAPAAWLSSAPSVLPRSPQIYLSKPSDRPTAFGTTGMGVHSGRGGAATLVWDQPACLCRDAQIESLKKEVDMLRAEMEKIKLEVKSGRGAAGVGEWGVF